MRNIILVGFMGTGKSAVAKRLARRLGMRYVNTDDIIEEKEKRPISRIFAEAGEPYFRGVEKEVVREVSLMDNAVVACGGGVVLDGENIRRLKKKGIVVALKARPEDIFRRTEGRTHRPLLNVEDPLSRIRELLKTRAPFYAKADCQIDTSYRNVDEVAEEIERLVAGKGPS